jgi:hypothetical protein
MKESGYKEVFDRVRADAFQRVRWPRRQATNLYLDERPYAKGEVVGPRRQKIVAERPSVLVFADDEPLANFAHACRYLLYDAKSGELQREVEAQFPPIVKERSRTLKAFHEPVQFIAKPNLFRLRPVFRCPIIIPDGTRYAILFSGMTNKRHLNDMEFLYRTLVDTYAFNQNHIYVLNYDGTRNTQDGVQAKWPGDDTAYRINVTGEGTQEGFEDAIDDLKSRIKRRDLLLIHSNNHGGYDGTPGTANLCTYPDWDGYYASDFANKVGELPAFHQLIVMMEQCHAGGFNSPIISQSTADATSVASAATEPNNSYVTADGNWDPFARDWISAMADLDPFGTALASDPDTDGDGGIEAEEAYDYANSVKDPRDTPNYNESSAAGGEITLGQRYVVWRWWCMILREVLKPHFTKLPPPVYYERVRKIQPKLTKLAESLDKISEQQRKEYTRKIQEIVTPVFADRRRVSGNLKRVIERKR